MYLPEAQPNIYETEYIHYVINLCVGPQIYSHLKEHSADFTLIMRSTT